MKKRNPARILVSFILVILSSVSLAQSPYRTSWSLDGSIVGAVGLIGLGAVVVADNANPLTVDEVNMLSRNDVNRFDRGATCNYSEAISSTSDWLLFAAIASPLCLLSGELIQADWQTYLTMYAETMMLTGFSAQLTKGGLPRTRPFVYNTEAPLEPKVEQDARKSFYSSHSSIAFASAVFLSTTFGDYFPSSPVRRYVWAGSLVLATAVGSLRYASGAHFPTDILVGAAVGSAFGYLIPLLHRTDTGPLSIVPSTNGNAARLDVVYRF